MANATRTETMAKRMPVEFLFQLFALIVSVIIIHAAYVSVIRPNAETHALQEELELRSNPSFVPERSLYVVIKDFEQEACFILGLWAMALMGFKAWELTRERTLLRQDLVRASAGISILPEDTREYSRPIQALPASEQSRLLPRALLTALHRFRSTRNIQDVSTAVRSVCESETERLDSELSMVRYIAWAIPSIGFLGTVRGIGGALARAYEATLGNIGPVTQMLGVAFNSTFIALLISIVVMFVLHQLQHEQERLVMDTQNYADQHLIQHLQTR